jgi:pyruvate-ferredoxin/flavodoxin oxidoreductase
MGGDGAMLDIGFQNLSRLMASGKPVRVVMLDTQVYSNTGGQASTGTFTGQSADMSPHGKAMPGKSEERKELAYIAIAHRGAFVHQTSQASASHMIEGLIKGLQSRRPAVFSIYTPCPVEHGLPDEWAPKSARMALESRAFPFVTYDPDGGKTIAECMSLDGNPSIDEVWPTYELKYLDANGDEQILELPMTVADWAATETRFKKQFKEVPESDWNEDMVPFAEFLTLDKEDRAGKTPYIHTLSKDRRLSRLRVAKEIVKLAEERLLYWNQLREMAGLEVPEWVRDEIGSEMEAELESKLAQARKEFEAKLEELKVSYPRIIARRLAEGLVRSGNSERTVAELLRTAESTPGLDPIGADVGGMIPGGPPKPDAQAPGATAQGNGGVAVAAPPAAPSAAPAESVVQTAAAPAVEEDDDELAMEPYIETARCTTCDECTNINNKLFKYNDQKQAYIADARAGTFAEIVRAAEKCPAAIIHPGTPLNKKEKDLAKWVKRAEPFN